MTTKKIQRTTQGENCTPAIIANKASRAPSAFAELCRTTAAAPIMDDDDAHRADNHNAAQFWAKTLLERNRAFAALGEILKLTTCHDPIGKLALEALKPTATPAA
jgi:hypothetical protein